MLSQRSFRHGDYRLFQNFISLLRSPGQAISRRLSTAASGLEPRLGHVGFVVDKVLLGHVFSEYFVVALQVLHRQKTNLNNEGS
jgi:hypothetical protein